MTDSDDRVSRRYRQLAREEPPAAIDAAILAAARQAVQPRGRSRWVGPVSIAAVLILGLGVSLRMQTEQPGIETSVPSSAQSEYPLPQSAEAPAPAAPAPAADPAPAEPPAIAGVAPSAEGSFTVAPRLKRQVTPDAAPARESLSSARDERATELERIARLRVEGRHAEADKALADFRRKHPEYRIAEAMWERIRPR